MNIIGETFEFAEWKCEVLDCVAHFDSLTTEYWGAIRTTKWVEIDSLDLKWWCWDDWEGKWVEINEDYVPREIVIKADEKARRLIN